MFCRFVGIAVILLKLLHGLPLLPITFNNPVSNVSNQTVFSEPLFPDFSRYLNGIDLQYVANNGSNSTDVLSRYSYKWSTVGRISNGISLLAGLINDQIPINSVVGELLHLGDVDAGDLIGLDKGKLDAVAAKLETFSLDDSVDVKNLQDSVLGMTRVREIYMNITDTQNFVPPEYFTEADRFHKDTTGFTKLAEITEIAQNARDKFDNLARYTNLKSNFQYAIVDILKILEELGKIENPPSSFPAILQHLDTYGHLKNGDSLISLEQLFDLLLLHSSFPAGSMSDANKMGGNVDSVSVLSSTFNGVKSDLSLIRKVLDNRVHGTLSKPRYTTSFFNGASDLNLLTQDVLDSSIEKTLGTGKHYSRLSVGLQPLNTISNRLNAVELKLRPASKADVFNTANKALRLQQLLSGLSVTSTDAVAVARLFVANHFTFVQSKLTDAITVMRNSKKLSSELAGLKSSIEKFPSAPPEVDNLKQLLRTIKMTSALTDVQTFMTEFNNKKDEVDKVLAYLDNFLSFPNMTDLQAKAGEIINKQQDLDIFLNSARSDFIPKLEKFRGATEPVDAVAKALGASKIIQEFKGTDVSNLKLTFGAMEVLSESVKNIQTVPADMKREQTKDVQALVALKDSQNTSDTVGAIAGMIHSMDKLLVLNSTVEALKLAGENVFNVEFGKLTDPAKKNDIQTKWGDHSRFLLTLDTSCNQIRTFKSNLTDESDLRQLGSSLETAKTVNDVTGSAFNKSQALAMLIAESSDANNKRTLENIKANLDKLAALDLQFSSHHSAIPQASGSLKSLFDFLSGYLSIPSVGGGAIGAGGAGGDGSVVVKEKIAGWIIGLLIVIIFVVCFTLIGVGVYYWHRRSSKRLELKRRDAIKPWKDMLKWIENVQFRKLTGAEAFCRGIMNDLEKEIRPESIVFKKDKNDKMRYPDMRVIENTAVDVEGVDFMHANWITAQSGCRFIATQGPLDGTESGKVDTRGDLLRMCITKEAEFIVQLCAFEEEHELSFKRKDRLLTEAKDDLKHPEKIPEYKVKREQERLMRFKKKSARYFDEAVGKTMKIGEVFTVETKSLETLFGVVDKRELEITNLDTKEVYTLTHLFHTAWEDHGVPEEAEAVIQLMEHVRKSKKPIVVHCSAGVGRTATFIGIEVVARDIERHPDKRASEMFMPLRTARHNAVQTASQAYFVVICAIGLLVNKYSPKKKDVFNTHFAVFKGARSEIADNDAEEDRRTVIAKEAKKEQEKKENEEREKKKKEKKK